MILRSAILVASLAIAPIQCGHEGDPALRKDESPGDALWDLAQRFHEEHDDAAATKTLEYLVERYPASRWVPAAHQQLGLGRDAGTGPGG